MGEEKLHLISVYAPDINKRKEESDDFYDQLQTEIDRLPKTEKMLIMGDLNVRIGDMPLEGIKQRFNEH